MQVKTIIPISFGGKQIKKGTVFAVEKGSLLGDCVYRITDGNFKDYLIKDDACVLLPEENLEDIKKQLEEEKAKCRRAYEIVENLTYHLCNKNREIQKLEFYLEALTKGLNVAGEAMRELRKSTIVAKNG